MCVGDDYCLYYNVSTAKYSCKILSNQEEFQRFGKETISSKCVDKNQ